MSTFRLPQTLTPGRAKSGLSVIEAELSVERGEVLGRMGRTVETAVGALLTASADDANRPTLLKAASDATWQYFVQREACGILTHKDAVDAYRIPREVLVRVGIFR